MPAMYAHSFRCRRLRNQLLPVLRAENQMDMILSVTVRHVSRLRRSGILSHQPTAYAGGLDCHAPSALMGPVRSPDPRYSEYLLQIRVAVSLNPNPPSADL